MSTEGKPIRCRAAVLWKEGEPLTVEEITVAPPKKGEVRVRMVSAGLCATDAHFVWGWKTDLALDFEGKPVVLGHEGAGVVESVGAGVTSVGVGDKVMAMWMPECGECALCKNPATNFCSAGNFYTTLYHDNHETRMEVKGQPILSLAGTSTFAEYSVMRDSQVAKLNPLADLNSAAIIGCAVGTGYGSATNIARVHKGAKCAVWGLGAIGLSAVMGCRDAGAELIVGVDINGEKEAIARQTGCHEFLNANQLEKPLDEILRAKGIEFAFDCIGNQQVLDCALKSLTPWGFLTVIGLGKRGNAVTTSVAELLEGRHVAGGYFGNMKPREANQRLVDMLCAGELEIKDLITHRIRLEDINAGFDVLKAGKTIRTVIQFEEK
ncbi:unnamed protein product [Medioppia subpectinata]|uniref:Enoyl reductase (ER) domain-containing protein n=1 Tax=Medioppia subpectinata TaxID=1979941 RepID=A0A7R9PTJ0_9ACAR|nr:unnamed protein product [Medioppia subpectinata]CAG2100505.1 unnamed protein product [Medioppia subpectinata]